FLHAKLFLGVGEGLGADVDGEGRAHLAGQLESVGVDVGNDDVSCPGMPGDGDGHDADGAGPGDEHVFAEHGEVQGGVDGVAEGVEDRLDVADGAGFGIGEVGVVYPDVGHRQGQVLGERAGAVDAD